jgi:hypothetical protein
MSPAWWVTYVLLGMYGFNAAWLLYLGMYAAAGYWVCAAGITVCSMIGFTR